RPRDQPALHALQLRPAAPDAHQAVREADYARDGRRGRPLPVVTDADRGAAGLIGTLTMLASDAYRPEQWHDFFVMVGGAAAVLTGLVFVALSLDLRTIVSDATHRNRAIATLTNLAAIFVVCALVLMGDQDHIAVGVEWLIVA